MVDRKVSVSWVLFLPSMDKRLLKISPPSFQSISYRPDLMKEIPPTNGWSYFW